MSHTVTHDLCPSIPELVDHLSRPNAEIAAHLEVCGRCRALFAELVPVAERESVSEPPELRARSGERPGASGAIAPGEVVTLCSELAPGELLVALVVDGPSFTPRVAPLSSESQLAARGDFIFTDTDTPLGYACFAELWNVGAAPAELIRERFGLISGALETQVQAARTTVGGEAAITSAPEAVQLFRDSERVRAGKFLEFVPQSAPLGLAARVAASDAGDLAERASENGWTTKALLALSYDVIERAEVSIDSVLWLVHTARLTGLPDLRSVLLSAVERGDEAAAPQRPAPTRRATRLVKFAGSGIGWRSEAVKFVDAVMERVEGEEVR